jgi:hypothetical protein
MSQKRKELIAIAEIVINPMKILVRLAKQQKSETMSHPVRLAYSNKNRKPCLTHDHSGKDKRTKM